MKFWKKKISNITNNKKGPILRLFLIIKALDLIKKVKMTI